MLNIARDLVKSIGTKWNSGKVLILVGPRQVGKTTLLKSLCEAEGSYLFINGDNADDRLQLENAGENKLRSIIGAHKTVFIDEAQRIPDIGIILKIIHDQMPGVRLLVSGSSALEIGNSVNEPLTGRKWEYNLYPLAWNELKNHFGLHWPNEVKNQVPDGIVSLSACANRSLSSLICVKLLIGYTTTSSFLYSTSFK
jgi:predicted AAA+ superfamily ATPase